MMHIHSSRKSGSKLTAAIVGARGYSGLELAKLLFAHPQVEFTHAFATRAFQLSDDILDSRAARVTCLTEDQILSNLTDVVFLATPAEASYKLAPQIAAQGKLVIDLSGAFRLGGEESMRHYGFATNALGLKVQYGLVPFCAGFFSDTQVISNPGCYATAISMALIPLLKHGLVEPLSIMVDAKSGTSGAGRKASENLLFSEVEGHCLPYRVGVHQHLPEVQMAVKDFAQANIDPHLVTHLLPVKRGIVATVMAKAKTTHIEEVAKAFALEYSDYKLVRHGSNIAQLASLPQVVNTPFTHISYTLVGDKLYVFSALDNLMKGAASQAIENLNRALDLPPHFSLAGEG